MAASSRYIHKFRHRIFPGNSFDCIGRINNRIKRAKKKERSGVSRGIRSRSVNVRRLRRSLTSWNGACDHVPVFPSNEGNAWNCLTHFSFNLSISARVRISSKWWKWKHDRFYNYNGTRYRRRNENNIRTQCHARAKFLRKNFSKDWDKISDSF